jgi:hypothetical protein
VRKTQIIAGSGRITRTASRWFCTAHDRHLWDSVFQTERLSNEVGLMKGQWSADDLRTVNSAWLGLPVRSEQSMEKEARRRVLIAQNLTVR